MINNQVHLISSTRLLLYLPSYTFGSTKDVLSFSQNHIVLWKVSFSNDWSFLMSLCLYSGHCYFQSAASDVEPTSPVTKSPHMVALVSFPPHRLGQRGLSVDTDYSQDKSALVTVTEWVSEFSRETEVNSDPSSCLTQLSTFHSMIAILFRLDSSVLSPDQLSSVHTGDRVLEVNGIPVRNICPEEVGIKLPTV